MTLSFIHSTLLKYRRGLTTVAILGFGLLGFILLVATKPVVQPQPRQENIRKVSAILVDITSAQPQHKAFGAVRATRTADLRFAIGGIVATVNSVMKNGAVVEKDTVLAELDLELLNLARDDILEQINAEEVNNQELAVQFDLRARQFNRVTEMAAALVVSEKRLDEAKLSLSIAKNALQQSTSRLRLLNTNLKRSARNIEDAKLTAPFDGVLSNVAIGGGRLASSANALGTITDLSSLEVSFVVPAEIYTNALALIGANVSVAWKAGGRDVNTVVGTIARAEGNVNAGEGGGRIYASIPYDGRGDDGGGELAPIPNGAFVEITYPSAPLDNIIILPESALFDPTTVFVIADDRTEMRRVTVISKNDGVVYLRGDLAQDEMVITTRLPGLGGGTLVEVITR